MVDNTSSLAVLLVLLNVCHFLADYTWLSTPWMLKAKANGRPLFPISMHALVHALLMWFALHLFLGTIGMWGIAENLFLFQWATHFLIDTAKGRLNGKYVQLQSTRNVWHWVVFGGDQLLHQIVIILMAYYATTK